MMGMVRARYTLEFKQEAVRLVRGGQTVSSVAKTLGLLDQTLHNWLKAEAAGRLREFTGKAVSAEQMEIARLKAELAKTRMECDILKNRRRQPEPDRGSRYPYKIGRKYRAGWSRAFPENLGRPPSTISREINRNHGRQKHGAINADERAWRQASRPKPCLLAGNRSLQIVVAKKLDDHRSPQQVSGWLKIEYLDDRTMRMSHETTKACLSRRAAS
jgi:transposase-like protein